MLDHVGEALGIGDHQRIVIAGEDALAAEVAEGAGDGFPGRADPARDIAMQGCWRDARPASPLPVSDRAMRRISA